MSTEELTIEDIFKLPPEEFIKVPQDVLNLAIAREELQQLIEQDKYRIPYEQ